jgi:hypothetical protein
VPVNGLLARLSGCWEAISPLRSLLPVDSGLAQARFDRIVRCVPLGEPWRLEEPHELLDWEVGWPTLGEL